MIDRYTLSGMKNIWEQKNKFDKWLSVEILAAEALSELGKVPKESIANIKKRAGFNINRINEIEKTTKHDVISFLTAVAEEIGEDSRFLHLGLTSSDILDTSLAILMAEAADIILSDLEKLLSVLKKRALEHKDTVMIGRTHGIHAEPITFGFKLALWYEETKRNYERMKRAKDVISFGKLSGAVGTFANIDPFVEEYVCKRSGLKPDPASSQIIQRDRHAEYLLTLSLIASSIDKFAIEIRHLQRTEVLEAEEYFTEGQKGSSAMPHKRNPITCENLSGLARLVRANAIAALENIPLWHERDISHSSVERVVIPDSTILIDYMLVKITSLIDLLKVYPENMLINLNKTQGLVFSERILLEIVNKGLKRDDAYKIVQRNAMKVWEGKGEFKELLKKDKELKNYLSDKEIEGCFDLKHHLKNIDYIFKRIFREG
ncbi:MAG: adenylosuccinate lyase [Nitrospirae bacterium]|nr:adenylosuccinate lyase [Nitrospirota bacterium]